MEKTKIIVAFVAVVVLTVVAVLGISACTGKGGSTKSSQNGSKATVNDKEEEAVRDVVYELGKERPKEIYLAGGCFWGVQAYFERIPGIIETEVGYANGSTDQTSYKAVSQTGHSETVRVRYDANKIHLAEILDRYYKIIDPLSVNKQGNDRGTQYRTGIYWIDDTSKQIVMESVALLNERLGEKSAIELAELKNYVVAEDYHQDYLDKNPGGYCHINVASAGDTLYPGTGKPSDGEIKSNLSTDEFVVTQQKGTERPYSSQYDKFTDEGIYVDVVGGQPLYSSADKYDAGCGWPSFTKPITTDAVVYEQDTSHGMHRIGVESAQAQSHNGHVFNDGPAATGGLRYCINGVALKFIPKDEMKAQGYGSLLPYLIKQ